MGDDWMVARTQPRRERTALDHAGRQGYECYLPLLSERGVVRPMFPSYVFVRWVDAWRSLTGTVGVSGLVMGGESPARLPGRAVAEMRSREDARGVVVLPVERFSVGQRVRATRGALAGVVGLYQGQTSLEREVALFQILGRETPVSVGVGCLEAA